MSGTRLGAKALCHSASRVLAVPRPDWLPLTHSNTSTRCSGPTRGLPSKAPTTGECHCQCTQTALHWLDPHQHRAGGLCLQLPKFPRPPGMCPTGCEIANALSHECTQAVMCWRALLKGLPASVRHCRAWAQSPGLQTGCRAGMQGARQVTPLPPLSAQPGAHAGPSLP